MAGLSSPGKNITLHRGLFFFKKWDMLRCARTHTRTDTHTHNKVVHWIRFCFSGKVLTTERLVLGVVLSNRKHTVHIFKSQPTKKGEGGQKGTRHLQRAMPGFILGQRILAFAQLFP